MTASPEANETVDELRRRLAEAEETLRALRNGEVDAVVAAGPGGSRVYTLKGADEPYRLLVQEMSEGALTLASDGLILFSNQQFANTIGSPLERIIGCKVYEFLDPGCLETARALLDRAWRQNVKLELKLRRSDGTTVPAYVSLNRLQIEGMDAFCMVVTDLTDQKRNEEVAIAEKLARSILEQAAEAILVLDLDGRIIRASRATDRLAGASVILRSFADVFRVRSPGGLPLSWESISAMAGRDAGTEPLEMTVTVPSGATHDVLFSVARLGAGESPVSGCIVHLTDISHRKRIEKTLRDSEALYRSMADAMPQIVYVNRPDGSCEFVNRRWQEFTGETAPADNVDFAQDVRFHPDDRLISFRQWERSVATGQNFEVERRLLRHDGQYRWHLSRAVPIRDEEGTIVKWVGTSTDIDEFKQNERSLRESEARLAALAETVPEILFTAGPDGQGDYSSPRAHQFTGLSPATMDGSGWLDALHPEDIESVRRAWMASTCSGEPYSAEFRLRRADGAYRWMQSRAVPMLGEKGEVLKWFGTCTDVDDHKRLEDSLLRRSEELARSNEELQRFAYIVSHDLQEPLRTIGAMSQLLRLRCAGILNQEGEILFGHIQDGVTRMSDLIRDLLEYSRVSSENGVELKPIDCESLLSFALMNVQAQIAATGAIVTRGPMPSVTGDEQLIRVFQNLIGNALKYRGDRVPQIHIAAERKNDDWVISVRDNGIGIDMQYGDRIFGVFQRLHSRKEYEGTGIGLAICRKIMERYGGRIWVESKPGAGSTFSFALRAAQEFASSAGEQ